MSFRAAFLLAATLASGLAPLRAQAWDPDRATHGWAFQEVDGSLIFFDPASRALKTWMKEAGLLSSLTLTLPEVRKPAAKSPRAAPMAKGATDYDAAGALLYGIPTYQRTPSKPAGAKVEVPSEGTACEAQPERWVLDAYNRIWMVCDGQLAVLGKDGRAETLWPLPGQVEDMALGRDGLFLLYRTLKPYLEKRDLKSGAVLWTYGDRAQLKEAAAQPLLVPLNRMALGADGTVFLAEGASLAFTVLDPVRGPKQPGQTFFTCREDLPARALLGRQGRGPILPWAGREVVFGVFTPAQVKSCGAPESQGLVLARFDLLKGTLDWLPTPLAEGHRLVGLLDHEAVFLAPGGGLAYAPIH
ncbi:hypothetical protein GETHOR_08330 [Geothrix oryzae]|uniref:Uncharacterized protein n=1 Tax=Geothrix oryzae TaxID=2927975 RepID=A0ABN6UVE7_9BACT|nr:hypothetical protein [Geothrix oryzae]BDU68732.1 hypothetical protein GETHOR_08330 [Geothrix oryzae]